MHRASNECSFQSANGSEASGGCRPTEQLATELVAKNPDLELSGMTEIACGSKEFHPPFPFPPRASRGGVGSPHAGSTLRANKKRLARIDAAGSPHKRGCRPLVDPLRARWRIAWTAPKTACFTKGSRPKTADVGESLTQKNSTIRLLPKKQRKAATAS
jgi:hypothetical protein